MEEIKKLIGLRLKEARLACNMTQEELARIRAQRVQRRMEKQKRKKK